MYLECRHIKPNGSKCHSPAMKEKPYCYYHIRVHKLTLGASSPAVPYEQQDLEIPYLEDRAAVQIALSEVVSALAQRRIEFKRAALMIYALQVASSNAKTSTDLVAVEQVRDASQNEQGEHLAPETTTYEPDDEEYDDPNHEPTICEMLRGGIKLRQEANAEERRQQEAAAELSSSDDEDEDDDQDEEPRLEAENW